MYIGVEDNQHQVFSLSASPPYFLRQGFSFALDLTNWIRAINFQDCYVCASSEMRCQVPLNWILYRSVRDLNSHTMWVRCPLSNFSVPKPFVFKKLNNLHDECEHYRLHWESSTFAELLKNVYWHGSFSKFNSVKVSFYMSKFDIIFKKIIVEIY